MKELTWVDMNEGKWTNGHEWMEVTEWKLLDGNEPMDQYMKMNEPKWINWIEWLVANESKWSNWNLGMETDKFPKVAQTPQFLQSYVINYLMIILLTYESELSLQSRAPFVDHFPPIEASNHGNRDLPAATQTATHPKNTGFRARVFFQAWIHACPIAHTSQLITWWWCGWHDDWDDDTVRLPWWWDS